MTASSTNIRFQGYAAGADKDSMTAPRNLRGGTMVRKCSHVDQVQPVKPVDEDVCPECVAMGDQWVHLRWCRTCGHVGCCDSSKNKHATKHFHATGHPIVQSLEPGEDWNWCYVDQAIVDAGGS